MTFGIRGKLIVFTLAIVMLVGSGLSWFFLRKLNVLLIEHHNATTELITESTLNEVRDLLYFLNVNQVREVLKRALSRDGVKEAVVLDKTGRILSDGTSENRNWLLPSQDDEVKRMVATRQPVNDIHGDLIHRGRLVEAPGGELLGFLYLEHSMESLQQAKQVALWFSLGITAMFLALGAILAWLLAHRATGPLRHMLAAVQRIGAGELTKPLPTGRRDEIGALQDGINAMAKSIHDATVYLEDKIKERTDQLDTLSKTDLLTHLLNRRGMTERIELEIIRAKRENKPLGLLWIDADHFKAINDTHGHAVGDRALVIIGDSIRSTLRPYDCASRWGGDEFMAMFMDADEAHLSTIADRLLSAVASNRSLKLADETVVQLHVTIGGASLLADDDLESLLHKADHALYRAKANGRNQYCNHAEGDRVETSVHKPSG
jgi:diguanylate cyclase (GGDEF)-like protein